MAPLLKGSVRDSAAPPPWRLGDRVKAAAKRGHLLEALAGLGLAGTVCFFVLAAVTFAPEELAETTQWVEHTHQVLDESAALLLQLDAAQSGYRGYLLTRDEDELQLYTEAREAAAQHLVRLSDLTRDNPRQVEQVKALAELVQGKLAAMARLAALARAGKIDEALAVMNAGQGKRLMAEVQAATTNVNSEEHRLLLLRRQAVAAAQARAIASRYRLLAGVLVLLLVSGGGSLFLLLRRRENRKQSAVQMAAVQLASGMRRLAETCPVGMLHCDLDGQVLTANDMLLRMIGRTRAELDQGRIRWNEMTPPEWATADQKAIAELLDHGSCTPFEKEYLRPDGQRIPILISARMLDADSRAVAAYIVDLSERKRAEAALRRSDERWLAIEAADLGTWHWDVAADEYGMSTRCKQMFGLPTDADITRDCLFAAVYPEDRTRLEAALAASMHRGTDHDVEIRSVWPDTTVHWLRLKGRTFRDEPSGEPWVQGVLLAIDAQKAIETALRESESRWRGVFENMHEGFFVAELVRDPATGAANDFRCLEANPALGKHTGLHVPAVIGRTVSEVIPGFQQQLIDMFAGVVRTGEPAYAEIDVPALGGKWFEARTHRVDGAERFAVLFMEITSRKQAEARIQAALREKDLLLAEIHHRVKNNLQIIDSLLNLQSGNLADEGALSLLRESQNRIKSMAMIHQTLYESNNFEAVDFSRFLESLAPMLVSSYSSEAACVEVSIDASDVMLPISAAVPCGLVANELVSNALKHAFPERRSGEIRIELARESDCQARLTVGDNGVGMPESFDLATTTTLGLQLVTELAAQLGGTLAIRRADPTRFQLLFPIPS